MPKRGINVKISKKDALTWFEFFASLPEEEELMPQQTEIALSVFYQIETAVNARRRALMADIPGLKSLAGRTDYVGDDSLFPQGCKSCLLGTGLSAVRKTNRCNAACPFCYDYGALDSQMPVGEGMWEIGGTKFYEEDLDLLLSIHRRPTGISYVYLEPFMEIEKYYGVIRKFHEAGIYQHMYTNGISATRENLKALADNGTNILIVSSDPNITDAFAEKLLGLPADSVRVISKNAGEKIAALQSTVTDAEDTGIVFTSGYDTLCRCAASAVKLDKLKKLSKLICEICCCTGAALALIFAVAGTVSVVSGWLSILLQLLGMALSFLLPPLLTASSLPAFGRSKVRPVPVNEPYLPENYTARPQKIEDEEEPEETPEEAPEDEDVKLAPEPPKKRFGRLKNLSAWEEDEDDEDDFDFPARRESRFSKTMRSRFAKTRPEAPAPQEEPEEAPGNAAPVNTAPRRAIPDDPDDIHLSTEDLLNSSFFRDEEEEPAPRTRRAPSLVNEYDEEEEYIAEAPGRPAPAYRDEGGYDDEDYDDDLFGDGLIGRLRNRGKRRKRGAEPDYDEFYDEPLDGDADYEETADYDEPERPGRRGKKSALPTAEITDAVKDLSARVTSFARHIGKKEDGFEDYDDEEDDLPPEGPHSFMTSSAPAARQRNEAPAATSARSAFAPPADMPAPPHYELGKTDEYDFLNAKFEPPQVRPGDFYNDAYFSRYDRSMLENDADAVFTGLKETKE